MVFNSSTNATVHGGSFNEIQGDYNSFEVHGNMSFHDSEAGITALKDASALDAMHDSFERHPPPKCYPGTRQTALQSIDSWVEDTKKACLPLPMKSSSSRSASPSFSSASHPEPRDSSVSASKDGLKIDTRGKILWLHGPAGAGKSAVAQTVSETYAEKNNLVGSFFFSRETPGRNTAKRLFPTISYQIAMRIPGMRSKIGAVVKADPSIFDKSLDAQIHRLIILPFKSSVPPAQYLQTPFLIVLDGLDECGKKEVQVEILSHVADIAYDHGLPLCFIIASRPEPHIKAAFRSDPFQSQGLAEVSLYAGSSLFPNEADLDVLTVLLAEFERIYHSQKHHEYMQFVPWPWPSRDMIECLVRRSGGYFIYVATIFRFVDEEFSNPVDRLQLVLDASPLEGPPFAELDNLYRQILSTNPKRHLLVQILGAISVPLAPSEDLRVSVRNPEMLERVFGFKPGTVRSMLGGMHSLLRVEETVRSFHASLQDFLFDKDRAGDFFVDRDDQYSVLALTLLKIDERWQADTSSLFENLMFMAWPFYAAETSHSSNILAMVRAIDVERWKVIVGSLRPTQYYRITYMLCKAIIWSKTLGPPAQDLVSQMTSLLDYAFTSFTKFDPGDPLDPIITQGLFTLCTFDRDLRIMDEPRLLRQIRRAEADSGFQAFADFVTDPVRSSGIFAATAVCHSRLALGCMYLLGNSELLDTLSTHRLETHLPAAMSWSAYHWYNFFVQCRLWSVASHFRDARELGDKTFQKDVKLSYSRDHWATHLSISPPGDDSVLQCLRNVGGHLVNRIPSCQSSTCEKVIPTQPHDDHGLGYDHRPSRDAKTHDRDLANAKMVVAWLKKMQQPPYDLLREWTPCERCAGFHSFQAGQKLPTSRRRSWLDVIKNTAKSADALVPTADVDSDLDANALRKTSAVTRDPIATSRRVDEMLPWRSARCVTGSLLIIALAILALRYLE